MRTHSACRPYGVPSAPHWVGTAILLLILIHGVAIAQTCPLDTLRCNGVSASAARSNGTSCLFPSGSGSASYYHPSGWLQFYASNGITEFGGAFVSIAFNDEYVITGLEPGTPLQLTATLQVNGSFAFDYACENPNQFFRPFGEIRVQLSADNAPLNLRTWCGPYFPCDPPYGCGQYHNFSSSLVVSFPATGGQPFRLRTEISGRVGMGGCDANAQLRFDGLPSGASIASCKGFEQAPTAPRAATWGHLKIRYR